MELDLNPNCPEVNGFLAALEEEAEEGLTDEQAQAAVVEFKKHHEGCPFCAGVTK